MSHPWNFIINRVATLIHGKCSNIRISVDEWVAFRHTLPINAKQESFYVLTATTGLEAKTDVEVKEEYSSTIFTTIYLPRKRKLRETYKTQNLKTRRLCIMKSISINKLRWAGARTGQKTLTSTLKCGAIVAVSLQCSGSSCVSQSISGQHDWIYW